MTNTDKNSMSVISFLLFFTFLLSTDDISMCGIKINDNKKVLDNINLKIVIRSANTIEYVTPNGNLLQCITKDDKIVCLENDWIQSESKRQALITNFQFGKTSYNDIKNTFGSAGYTHTSWNNNIYKTDSFIHNCYELNSANNEVLVMVSKLPLIYRYNEHKADSIKLDRVILADKNYLDEIWGAEKTYDKQYRKITSDEVLKK